MKKEVIIGIVAIYLCDNHADIFIYPHQQPAIPSAKPQHPNAFYALGFSKGYGGHLLAS